MIVELDLELLRLRKRKRLVLLGIIAKMKGVELPSLRAKGGEDGVRTVEELACSCAVWNGFRNAVVVVLLVVSFLTRQA